MNWRYIEGRAANALGRLGERVGAHWLIYSPLRMHQFHLMAMDDAESVVGSLIDVFGDARTFGDIGCGTGAYAAEINRRGRTAVGYEYSVIGRLFARRQGVSVRRFDLATSSRFQLSGGARACTSPSPNASRPQFDLVYCFEVAEHLSREMGDELVRCLSQLSKRVVFSAARPGQGGTGHINEQSLEYWRERFYQHDFVLASETTLELRQRFQARSVGARWFHENTQVFITRS